jgi:gamma-glutamyl-gamma-aminobutyrate hydrolase PuuD
MFGEEALPEANLKLVPPQRPAFELELLKAFGERGKPIFGICYGCQLMNVWRGGSLIQDIPMQIPQAIVHRGGEPWARHEVRVKPNTRLHTIVEMDEFDCVSSHHQALAHIPAEAAATSFAPDGIVESLEYSGTPFHWGVQWHPECDRESIATQRIFAALVEACRR